jgi:hypothetical protein
MDVTTLAQLLHETAEHHDPYEKAAPPHDWWDWYAAFMVARQNGNTRRRPRLALGAGLRPRLTGGAAARDGEMVTVLRNGCEMKSPVLCGLAPRTSRPRAKPWYVDVEDITEQRRRPIKPPRSEENAEADARARLTKVFLSSASDSEFHPLRVRRRRMNRHGL